jgi:hypothetical protein
MKGKLNELTCRHRFWRWIAIHAPAVIEDLFARYDNARWKANAESALRNPQKKVERVTNESPATSKLSRLTTCNSLGFY